MHTMAIGPYQGCSSSFFLSFFSMAMCGACTHLGNDGQGHGVQSVRCLFRAVLVVRVVANLRLLARPQAVQAAEKQVQRQHSAHDRGHLRRILGRGTTGGRVAAGRHVCVEGAKLRRHLLCQCILTLCVHCKLVCGRPI